MPEYGSGRDGDSGMSVHMAGPGLRLEVWRSDNDEQDLRAADSYLSLGMRPKDVKRVVKQMRKAPVQLHPSADLLRMAGLPLLGIDDAVVKRQLMNLMVGHLLSPVLLVRGDLEAGLPLVIANGYQRLCAGHYVREAESAPCRIVDL